jgi:hypothetical protein
MKIASLAFGVVVVTTINAAAAVQTLTLFPEKNPKKIDPDGLYLVSVDCGVEPSPEDRVNVFEKKVRESGFTITLSNARIGANEAPPPASVLAAIPVFSSTISTSPPPTMHRNSGCDQSLLIPGRTPLYLTAVWTDQQKYTPSGLIAAIDALAGLAAPLGVLFPAGPANLLKKDTSVASSMTGPFSKLVTETDWSATQSESTSELKETTYTVSAKYFTQNSWSGRGTLSPAAKVKIKIKRINSIQEVLSEPRINSEFDRSIQDFATQIQKDPTTCGFIGKTLEFSQDLPHADAVYALARAVVRSAIPSNKVTPCLGKTYGPEVIQDNFWKKNSHMTLTADQFPEIQDVAPPFSLPIFDMIASAMTRYAGNKHNNMELGSKLINFFTATIRS